LFHENEFCMRPLWRRLEQQRRGDGPKVRAGARRVERERRGRSLRKRRDGELLDVRAAAAATLQMRCEEALLARRGQAVELVGEDALGALAAPAGSQLDARAPLRLAFGRGALARARYWGRIHAERFWSLACRE
jgi:hypothetical protein